MTQFSHLSEDLLIGAYFSDIHFYPCFRKMKNKRGKNESQETKHIGIPLFKAVPEKVATVIIKVSLPINVPQV